MQLKCLAAALLAAGFWPALTHADAPTASLTASLEAADLWIGLDASDDGFLLNPDTGDLWMTGICLKPLKKAEKTGSVWTSRTSGMVSVGRAMAMLDQTFMLDTNPAQPAISINNPVRGGLQTLPAIIELDCAARPACAARRRQPLCED
jgi:hypothetical protein